MASDPEYGHMDDEDLVQLQEAYTKLGKPVPPSLESELVVRALIKDLSEQGEASGRKETEVSSSSAAKHNAHRLAAEKQTNRFLGGSVDRRQRICLWMGFLLLVIATLFPPWSFRYPGSAYGLLFHPPYGATTVSLTRLFVEWALIALITCGLFFLEIRWLRKFLVPIVVTFMVGAVGLAYYASTRIVRDLPATENSKLLGGASITNYGRFAWSAYNGSAFVLTEVRVSISVFDEKGNTVISKRVYRVPAYDFYPEQTKELSTDVGFSLAQDQTWEFVVVGAKGRPE